MSNRVECPTVDEYTGATKALVKMALESGNGEMLRNLKVVMDFTKDCADRVNTVEAVLKAAYFCEAHEPIPAQPETCCPMCEAVHQDDLREKAEAEAGRLQDARLTAIGCLHIIEDRVRTVELAEGASLTKHAKDAIAEIRNQRLVAHQALTTKEAEHD